MALILDGDKSAHTGFQIWLVALLFVAFYSDIHDTISRISGNVLNRQGSEFKEHLRVLESSLQHNLDIESLEQTLLQQIHDACIVNLL